MSAKQDVLAAFGGIPDLESLVPAAFLRRFGLGEPTQYGIVCRDVRAGIDRLEAIGAGPFLHAEVRPPGWTERGERKSVLTQMALGYVDHQQVELLGAGENTDLYAEKIPGDGGFALHHVGIAQLGMGRAKPALADAGFPPVVELGMRIGPLYSVDVAYFDTRDELGFYLEILEFTAFGRHAPLTEKLVSRIARLQRRFRRGGPSERA
jgi:hypothetical protein